MNKNMKMARKKPPAARTVLDGIIHDRSNPTAAWVERNAVIQAIQEEAKAKGDFDFRRPEFSNQALVNKYVSALHHITKAMPNLPAVQAYVQHAQRISQPVEGETEAGGRSLDNTQVQPTISALSGILRSKGLMRLADRVLLNRDPEHVPLDQYVGASKVRRPAAKAGFVEVPRSEQRAAISNELADFAPSIRPAVNDTLPLAHGHYQKVRKENRETAADETEHPLVIADNSAPLPLAEGPVESSGKRYRDTILRHAVNRLPIGDIIKRVSQEHGVTPATARKHVKAFFDTRPIHAQPIDPNVTKLARQKPLAPRELTEGVYPPVAGTRLAKHLKDLAIEFGGAGARHPIAVAAAEALARGPRANSMKGLNGGNAFIKLGKLLSAAGHPLSKTYNWPTMGESMERDAKVKEFLEKTFKRPSGMSDKDFFGRVINHYSEEAADPEYVARRIAADKQASHAGNHTAFWQRAHAAFGKDTKHLNDSLYRLHALAEDREGFAPTKEGVEGVSKPWNTANKGGGTGNKALKFSEFLFQQLTNRGGK